MVNPGIATDSDDNDSDDNDFSDNDFSDNDSSGNARFTFILSRLIPRFDLYTSIFAFIAPDL